MEPLPPQAVNRRSAFGSRRSAASRPRCRLIGMVLLPLFTLATGCVTLDSLNFFEADPMPKGDVCQVVAAWHNAVVKTPDPVHGGQPTPGLAGRLYLFGPEIKYPLIGDGSLTVDVFDDMPTKTGGQPILLEEWRIDKDTLKRLARRDAIGWGYTLFLPWGTYRPDIKFVHLRVRYEQPKGLPIYSEGAPLTLNEDDPPAPALANPALANPALANRPGRPRG